MSFYLPELGPDVKPILSGLQYTRLRRLHATLCKNGIHSAQENTVTVYADGLLAKCSWCGQEFPFCPGFLQ